MAVIPRIDDAQTLAQAIVDTIHEPLLVLDADFTVLTASRSFYDTFKVTPRETQDCQLFALGDGQWAIPALRDLLETIIPERTAMDDFEVEHDFPGVGHRIMLLNARQVRYENSANTTILLAFTDVTARRALEQEQELLLERTETLLRQKQVLLQEMEHRVANSLQIIASILMLKARSVSSEETRGHLKDAHQRVMSVAAVQSYLHATEGIEQVKIGPYLTMLCGSLGASMINETQPIALVVTADEGELGSAEAVSIGLIVTELVINAIKYAFPGGRADAAIGVTFVSDKSEWTLTVSDNGGGVSALAPKPSGGLGTVIVRSLVKQLHAHIETVSTPAGVNVSIAHENLA